MSTIRFGKLTILKEIRSLDHHRIAQCECDCGNFRIVRMTRLNTHTVTECARCAINSARLAGRFSRRRFSDSERKVRDTFSTYKVNARRKKINFDLSLDAFKILVSSPCEYCGQQVSQKLNGIDRVNNELGYTLTNLVSACSLCNYAKREMTKEEFRSWATRIYKHWCIR